MAVGFDGLSKFAHKVENLLVKIREKEVPVSTEVVTILLLSNDYLKTFLDALSNDPNATIDAGELLVKIDAVTTGTPARAEAAPAPEPVPESTLETCARTGSGSRGSSEARIS